MSICVEMILKFSYFNELKRRCSRFCCNLLEFVWIFFKYLKNKLYLLNLLREEMQIFRKIDINWTFTFCHSLHYIEIMLLYNFFHKICFVEFFFNKELMRLFWILCLVPKPTICIWVNISLLKMRRPLTRF